MPPDTSLERTHEKQTEHRLKIAMRADCASGSDAYARRINCTMSEFSSPQMRCMKFAAKYRTSE